LGAFWECLGKEHWPNVSDAPPIPRQMERFSPEGPWGRSLRLQLTQNPLSRIRICNSIKDRMLQVQNGRIHLNWLGESGGQYPRYAALREEFHECIAKFEYFLEDHNLDKIVPDQWEVTYVNKITSNIWQTPADWGFFKPLNPVPSIKGLIEAESFSGEWHFVIPEQRGRLHIQWQHAKETESDVNEHVQLRLTARGPIESGENLAESLYEGLDLGHLTIVQSFRNLMSDTANKEWNLNDVPSC